MRERNEGNILSAWLKSAKAFEEVNRADSIEANRKPDEADSRRYRYDRTDAIGAMMAELERGSVVAIERGRGMLILDPSRFPIEQSPSVALVSNMSVGEQGRVSLLDFDDEGHSFGIDPFAEVGDGEESVARRLDAVRETRNMLIRLLDIDMMDVPVTGLLDNILTLIACTPGATVMDIPSFLCHGVTRDLGLSFVPYDQGEECFPSLFMRFSPSTFSKMMRNGATDLDDRMTRLRNGRRLRHVLGQSCPGSIKQCIDDGGIVVVRMSNEAWVAPFCQELLLRTSGLGDGTNTKWTGMTTNEVFSSNPFDIADTPQLVARLDGQTRMRGMTRSRETIDAQSGKRQQLLASGDRIGLLRFCEGL